MYKSNTNRTRIKDFSNCGKTVLMNDMLSRKQGEAHINTKAINQYPQKYKTEVMKSNQ